MTMRFSDRVLCFRPRDPIPWDMQGCVNEKPWKGYAAGTCRITRQTDGGLVYVVHRPEGFWYLATAWDEPGRRFYRSMPYAESDFNLYAFGDETTGQD